MVSFAPFWSQSYSQPSQLQLVGTLQEKDNHGNLMSTQKVYAHEEIIIGRDANRCQHIVNDPVVSNKQIRIYTVIFDDDQSNGIPPLVYAEDLSRNGTYWNGSLIGKGNGGVLLSDGDILRVSPRICYQYRASTKQNAEQPFDLTQECEMKHFEKDYNVSDRKLGSGACGEVFMAIEQSRRTQLACKIVDLRKLRSLPQAKIGMWEGPAAAGDVDCRVQMAKIKSWARRKQKESRLEQQLKVYHREAHILASLSHPNIIGIEKVYVTDNSIYIFQDLVTGGDLFSFLERKNGKLSDVEAAVIVRQILIALEHLHDRNIVHRDLKPENILMTSLANGCRVVLTDFGHAKKIDNERMRMTTMVGTEQYIAPEIVGSSRHFKGKNGYTKAVDMWSLGCITVVLLTGGSPFVSKKTNQYCQKLAQECDLKQLDNDAEWQIVGKRSKDFVRRLLVLDEEQRMSVSEAKKHSWFSNEFHKVDFEEVYCRATKHWRPRTLKTSIIEVIDAGKLRELPWLHKGDLIGQQNNRKRSVVPMDPPYKPYPRRMSLSLLPKRRPGQSFTISDEARIAIEDKWSPQKMQGLKSNAEHHQVPLSVPDLEENDLNRQPDGPCTPEAARQNAICASRPTFTSPLRPSNKIDTSISRKAISKSRAAGEVQMIHEKANRAPLQTDRANNASKTPSTKSDLGISESMTVSFASAGDRTIGDNGPSGVTRAANEISGGQSVGNAGVAIEAAVFSPREEPIIGTDASDGKAWVPNDKLIQRQGGPSPTMEESGPPSLASDSDVKVVAGGVCPAQGAVEGIDMERPTLKPRSRLSSRPKKTFAGQSHPKKRRASVFDLEEDGDVEQSEHAFGKSTLGSNGMSLQPCSAQKKIKIGQSQGVHRVVHSESRLQMRGGGGFSAIRDGFTNIYLPR